MIMSILGGTVAVGIAAVSDEFITVWIGRDWVIPQPFSIMLGLELFILCVQYFLSKYRNALGLFQQLKALPIIGALLNLVTSMVLVHYLGISGVILGTIIAECAIFMVVDPYVIHRYGFGGKYRLSLFYLQFFKQLAAIVVSYIISKPICDRLLANYGWFSVALHIVICGVITPGVMLAVNCRNEEMHYVAKIVKSKLPKRFRRA